MFNENLNCNHRREFSFQGGTGASYKLERYTRLMS